MATSNRLLPFGDDERPAESRIDARDRAGRERAVDPHYNVALEASAGTGKTRVLVDRYVNLLHAGVDPANILAITFTRKAAAEMRERIVTTLRTAAGRGEFAPPRWRELRDRLADISISTIDAFCLSLLREFPLEADLDPGFSMADDTEVPRLVDESLDRALRVCRSVARDDANVALVFAQLGDRRARAGLAALLNRRLVAAAALAKYLSRGPRDLTVTIVARRGAAALAGVFDAMPGGLDRFLESGPPEPAFLLLARALRKLDGALRSDVELDPADVQASFARVSEHFLTQDRLPRSRVPYRKDLFVSSADWQIHRDLVLGHGGAIASALAAFRRDLNALVSRGVWRMFGIAEAEYRRTLEARAVLDFPDVLARALDLLRQMEEFSQSRYRLESRYHHVLVDEFQDTSRAQWELISLLIQSWGQGAGLAHSGPLQPSIFIVGDRKQSIYRFRDAEVSVLRDARRHLEALRPDGDVRRTISRSFRSVPALLAFVNDVCHDVEKTSRPDAFEYAEEDRFPLDGSLMDSEAAALGIITGESAEVCAERTAGEIARLIGSGATVRDRGTGLARPVRPGDIGVLFRTRESHRAFEDALDRRGIPAYVYKGLGFFDADEIKDALALIRFLADPQSDLRAAAWMRSRFVRLSDEGLRRLAPRLAAALRDDAVPAAAALDAHDARVLAMARAACARWVTLVDRLPPAELLDLIFTESAYVLEMRGPRFQQARENLKKVRALVRRIQNRGYATFPRIAAHLDRLAIGEEPNAVIDALDAVNLMTVHAAKGLEFPVVFVVNLARGTGNRRDPIRVAVDASGEEVSVAVGDFQSEPDEDEAAQEREETKRLLYVALTRARDRLYLGSVLKDARIQPGRGSLADVLPATLLDRFTDAACAPAPGQPGFVYWRAASGTVHPMRVCPLHPSEPLATSTVLGTGQVRQESTVDSDFRTLEDGGRLRQTVAAALSGEWPIGRSDAAGEPSDRLVGTLVHRLLQRVGLSVELSDEALGSQLSGLIRAGEAACVDNADTLVERVIALSRRLMQRSDLQEVYRAGDVLHEVPFTMVENEVILRGTIDCLVCNAGHVTVLELKTGRRRPEHEAQVELYARAAQRLFPHARIDARLVYADEGS